jgi:tetratricopeptide (TPR) repeat protein
MLVIATPQATAMMSGDEDARAIPADDDYAKGRAAFERDDWQGVIDHMTEVVRRRPWHDNAHSLLGFAHRKLGDFERSLAFYDKALTLNPHNRGALEYLGEAYLDLDDPARTQEILSRLAVECERVAANLPGSNWQAGCEEWVHLNAAYRAHVEGRPRPEHD